MSKKLIDLTVLYDADQDDEQKAVYEACDIAINNPAYIAGVCVNPLFVDSVSSLLSGWNSEMGIDWDIPIITVLNFPHGTGNLNLVEKVAEMVLNEGATELDLVIDWQKINETRNTLHAYELVNCIKRIMPGHTKLKVILETGELRRDLLPLVCRDTLEAGADFLKTSTGKTPNGADCAAVRIMAQEINRYYCHTSRRIGLKPSGGIKSAYEADLLINATTECLTDSWIRPETFRLGCSVPSAVAIIDDWKKDKKKNNVINIRVL